MRNVCRNGTVPKIPIEVMGIKQDVDLQTHKRLGFFPVFEHSEDAQDYVHKMLKAQGLLCNIIELDSNGNIVE